MSTNEDNAYRFFLNRETWNELKITDLYVYEPHPSRWNRLIQRVTDWLGLTIPITKLIKDIQKLEEQKNDVS